MIDDEYFNLRITINDCAGYRVLTDEDVLQRGDETALASSLLVGAEDWSPMGGPDDENDEFAEFFGKTVLDMNDPAINREMDATERLFRRKL